MRLHHVQVACPPGGEDAARRFWVTGLGLVEVEKPAPLRARGGAWFRASGDVGSAAAEIHVGVEEGAVPARKAHPALEVGGAAEFDALAARLEGLGYAVDRGDRGSLPGYVRFHTFDPHGNRVEIISPSPSDADRVGTVL